MANWRPPNWKNPYTPGVRVNKIFEAGADAMLDTIWRLAEKSPTKTFTFDANMKLTYCERMEK